jgi:hypothetical protein
LHTKRWQQRRRVLPNMPQLPFPNEVLGWNPRIHSGEQNLRWCWLRAVEWGRWPIFLSQPVAPVLLIWWPWREVILAVFFANCTWAICVRNHFVSRRMANLGVYVVAARWITWPTSVIYLFFEHRKPEDWIALAWPILIFAIGAPTPTRVGLIQAAFMRRLHRASPTIDVFTPSVPGEPFAAAHEVTDGAFQQKLEALMTATTEISDPLDVWLEPEEQGWSVIVRGSAIAAFQTLGATEVALTKTREAVKSRL